jgi:hypothetical protein
MGDSRARRYPGFALAPIGVQGEAERQLLSAELARLEDEKRMLQQPSTFQELLWGAWDGFGTYTPRERWARVTSCTVHCLTLRTFRLCQEHSSLLPCN